MKRCTIRDVANMAGVSISSVSRYLKNPTSINPAASLAISNAIKALDYVPNPFAQNLKKQSSNIIAVIIPDLSHTFFAKACRALEMLFYQSGYLVMICDSDEDPEKERFYIESMLQNRVAGILIVPTADNSTYLQNTIKENRNVVLFDRYIHDANVSYVCEDSEEAGYLLTNHMIKKGHKDFAVITGVSSSLNVQLRLKGIQKACTESNISLRQNYIFQNIADFSPEVHISRILSDLLQDPSSPRCIIATNPKLTDGLVVACYTSHIEVPTQLSLAGFALDNPQKMYSIPISVMKQDPYTVGIKAGELMLRQIKNKAKSTKQIILSMELLE